MGFSATLLPFATNTVAWRFSATVLRRVALGWRTYFGANAAWLRLAVIAHNVLQALKRLALPAELLTARPKRLVFLLFNMPGRLVHHARRLILRVAALGEWTAAYGEGLRSLPRTT